MSIFASLFFKLNFKEFLEGRGLASFFKKTSSQSLLTAVRSTYCIFWATHLSTGIFQKYCDGFF